MKYFCFLLLFTCYSYSQVPSNYYDSANGLSGYALKTELNSIITSGHNDLGYAALWTAYQTTDRDTYYENDNTILDIYSEIPTGTDSYTYTYSTDQCGNFSGEGSCYNREHLVPQSSFNEASPMRNDVHHVYPTDGYVNGGRGSFAFGIVASVSNTYSNGSKKGTSAVSGYSGTVFEPIDEFKGDVARALLYFATRYQTTVNGYTSFDMFNGTNNQVFQTWAINLLLDWHNNVDPVDQRDIDRNNAAYNFQGNANPFISHPEYANAIWNPNPDTQAPTTPTNLIASNPTASTVNLAWTASTDNIAVTTYDVYVDGNFYVTTNASTPTYTVTGLTTETTYTFTVLAKDAANNMSALSNSDTATTLAGSSGSSDLYFSEYMEGSSENKALEIANFTGSDITDLTDYELRLSSNGNAAWTVIYNFPNGASITNNDVYVIGHSNLAVCTGVVDNSNSAITGFNGNDAIGLFKNSVLIDIIGTLGDNATFAQNTTLVRNSNISVGNPTFNSSEWTSFASNTCSNLGQHTQSTLSTNPTSSNEFKIYPNPLKNNLLTIEVNQKTHFEIYNLLGKTILKGSITPAYNKVDLTSLNSGVYILKLKNNSGNRSLKLIKE